MNKKNNKCQLTSEALEEAFEEFFFSSGYLITDEEGRFKEINWKHRYSSWDLCYDYFQEHVLEKEKHEIDFRQAGLHLGFYLASWGMLRGSSNLLECGIEFFEKLTEKIKNIGNLKDSADVDKFKNAYEEIEAFLETRRCNNDNKCCRKETEKCSHKESKENSCEKCIRVSATHTLVTKIMLGVYGNFPALDDNFKKALVHYGTGISGNKCDKDSKDECIEDLWKKVEDIYYLKIDKCEHQSECNPRICKKGGCQATLKSFIGQKREKLDPKIKNQFSDAKILDALLFTIGKDLNEAEKLTNKKTET